VAVRKKDIKLAVNRNKIKRKIKGGFLANALNLSAADYVVLVKKNIPEMNKVITEEINEIWTKCLGESW
jgi:ribonuclease P protein component